MAYARNPFADYDFDTKVYYDSTMNNWIPIIDGTDEKYYNKVADNSNVEFNNLDTFIGNCETNANPIVQTWKHVYGDDNTQHTYGQDESLEYPGISQAELEIK